MGLEFITRIIKSTAIFSLVIALFWAMYFGWQGAVGFLIGVAWSLINLYFLRGLMKEVISPDSARKDVTVVFGLLKFPVLYFLGYLVINSDRFSIYSLLIGFSFMFAIILLKILGRMYLGLDTFSFKLKHPGESK